MQVFISLQTDNHVSTPPLSFFTGRMPFLPPNQQRQSTVVEKRPLNGCSCNSSSRLLSTFSGVQLPGEEAASIGEVIKLIRQTSLLHNSVVHCHFIQAVLAATSPALPYIHIHICIHMFIHIQHVRLLSWSGRRRCFTMPSLTVSS